MAPIELKELKTQLQELESKGFIRPSTLPWGFFLHSLRRKVMEVLGCVLLQANKVVAYDFCQLK